MTHVTLYIATSLDGYIARTDGGIDWLDTVQRPDTDYGYQAFFDGVDAVLLGRRTYDLCLTFGDWPYPGKLSVVFSRQVHTTDRDDVLFTAQSPRDVLALLSQRGVSRCWLVGGGELVAAFQRDNLIDEYIVSVIPMILGEGIALFPPPLPALGLHLVRSDAFPSGLVQLSYRRENQDNVAS